MIIFKIQKGLPVEETQLAQIIQTGLLHEDQVARVIDVPLRVEVVVADLYRDVEFENGVFPCAHYTLARKDFFL